MIITPDDSVINEFTLNPNTGNIQKLVNKHKFLDINHIKDSLLIKSGNWDVSGDLIIPSGYTVHSQDNVKLKFQYDKIFLSFSPLILKIISLKVISPFN